MWWAIVIAYAAVWGLTARRSAMNSLEETARERVAMRRGYGIMQGEPVLDYDDRVIAMIGGLVAGMFWPITLPGSIFVRRLVPPTERAQRERVELEELRALAKKHNLPMPNSSTPDV